jgi:hypothetical protein
MISGTASFLPVVIKKFARCGIQRRNILSFQKEHSFLSIERTCEVRFTYNYFAKPN